MVHIAMLTQPGNTLLYFTDSAVRVRVRVRLYFADVRVRLRLLTK